MQLDIFDDSRDIMLRNDVVHALERRDAEAARTAFRSLAGEYPQDAHLPALDSLIAALAQGSQPAFAAHDEASAARGWLVDRIEPAAHSVFEARQVAAWTAPLWRALAARAEALPYRSEHPETHAARLWLSAADPAAAAMAVTRIESWRRIPAPLAWMAEARHRIDGLEASWPLLAELAWLAPARFDALTRRLGDAALDKLRKAFDASFDGVGQPADLAWFPAWVLTEKPGLRRWLGLAEHALNSEAEQGMRRMLDLLALEEQGQHREMIERRRQLSSASPPLYDAYMRSR
jgi:hypothetical protein